MSDDMVVIHTAHDNAEADIVKGMLAEEGIPVFVQGYNHRSLLGMVGTYVDINIMVFTHDVERAKQCIAQTVAVTPAEDSFPMQNESTPKDERPKRWMFAIMLPFLLPGLGSYYVGRGDVGGWLLTFTGMSLFIFYMLPRVPLSILLIPVLIVTDLIISVCAMKNIQRK